MQEVCFDVAVSAQEETSGSGGGGIKVFVFDVTADAQRTSTSSTVSRVSFKIPFIPPATLVSGDMPQ
jgi:hypothetical protein